MAKIFTRTGDNGQTGLIGKERVSKTHPRIETLGSLDEASSALGFARSIIEEPAVKKVILQVQRDLYNIMAEIATTPENTQHTQVLKEDRMLWLESHMEEFSKGTQIPREFILPGETPPEAALSLARTIVRRAERRLTELLELGFIENNLLLQYLNRLSSFCFLLEVYVSQSTGNALTLAKGKSEE